MKRHWWLAFPVWLTLVALLPGCSLKLIRIVYPEPIPIPTPTPQEPNEPEPSPPATDLNDRLPTTSGGGTEEETGEGSIESFTRDLNTAIDIACGKCAGGNIPEHPDAFVKAVRDQLREYAFRAHYNWEAGELSMWRGFRFEKHKIIKEGKVQRPPQSFIRWANLFAMTRRNDQ